MARGEIVLFDYFLHREYMMKYIIPELTEGLIEVCKVVPIDPVDYLAEFIFKKSGEHRIPKRS